MALQGSEQARLGDFKNKQDCNTRYFVPTPTPRPLRRKGIPRFLSGVIRVLA